MNGKTAIELSAELALGLITANQIEAIYGSGMLSTVLGIGAGVGAAAVTKPVLDFVDDNTGLVSLGGDVIDSITDIFDW